MKRLYIKLFCSWLKWKSRQGKMIFSCLISRYWTINIFVEICDFSISSVIWYLWECIGKFLVYYKCRYEPTTHQDVIKILFLQNCKSGLHSFLSALHWKKTYNLSDLFRKGNTLKLDETTSGTHGECSSSFVTKSVELFAWQHMICVHGYCLAKTKYL